MAGCKARSGGQDGADQAFAAFLEKYFDERMALFPIEATFDGDNRFNDKLPIDFTDGYQETVNAFYRRYREAGERFEREALSPANRMSLDLFRYEMKMEEEWAAFHDVNSAMPFSQLSGLPLLMGQMGGGGGVQPFKTVKDYDDWLKRAAAFAEWSDSAIVYFRRGIAAGCVLPKALVVKMIPQMHAMVTDTPKTSLFHRPIDSMPAEFGDADRKRLAEEYLKLIQDRLVPAYRKLETFLQTEYLPKARTGSGVDALPRGKAYYEHCVRYHTTTGKTPEEIYRLGLSEVDRIWAEMEKAKAEMGFKGDMRAYFEFLKTDKSFRPYKTAEDVLNAYRGIQARIEPKVRELFGRTPKSKFEIRRTEAYRAATSSPEYYPGLPDGSRPGIFYVPIVDPETQPTVKEALFLHEAIPGHHFQVSLQNENEGMPKFRRFLFYSSFGEGYALYCESLGPELGIFADPYQRMGALGLEMHRAIRLVVDVGMHTGKMTREEAIRFSMEHEALSEAGITSEIERYMASPGQALSYKIGAMKIRELREKYTRQLGPKFKLAAFHEELLRDGCIPLSLVEAKMDDWAAR